MDAKVSVKNIFEESILEKQRFASNEANLRVVALAAEKIVACFQKGGKILILGNGGSAADSQHMAAELVVRFEKERKPLAAIALSTDTSILTAAANDYDFDKVFSRQVEALASEGDIVVAISTSGNSKNVLGAARAASLKKATVIALTGRDGGKLKDVSDIAIIAASGKTARVQEVHGMVIHAICKIVEDSLFA